MSSQDGITNALIIGYNINTRNTGYNKKKWLKGRMTKKWKTVTINNNNDSAFQQKQHVINCNNKTEQ